MTDPARRVDTAAADAGWLLRCAARYLRAHGQWRAAVALSRDADDLYADAGRRQPVDERPASVPGRVLSRPYPVEA